MHLSARQCADPHCYCTEHVPLEQAAPAVVECAIATCHDPCAPTFNYCQAHVNDFFGARARKPLRDPKAAPQAVADAPPPEADPGPGPEEPVDVPLREPGEARALAGPEAGLPVPEVPGAAGGGGDEALPPVTDPPSAEKLLGDWAADAMGKDVPYQQEPPGVVTDTQPCPEAEARFFKAAEGIEKALEQVEKASSRLRRHRAAHAPAADVPALAQRALDTWRRYRVAAASPGKLGEALALEREADKLTREYFAQQEGHEEEAV
jgi:hypothetical protein